MRSKNATSELCSPELASLEERKVSRRQSRSFSADEGQSKFLATGEKVLTRGGKIVEQA